MVAGIGFLPILLSWSCLPWGLAAPLTDQPSCPRYDDYAKHRDHEPYSQGKRHLPYQRPVEKCRKFYSPILEETIARLHNKIADPDLFRLFENAYPNTLDTAVLWTGFAWENGSTSTFTDESLAFVITGDINAMWLRDSANQILSYLPLLEHSNSTQSIAALFRGIINLHSRYIKISPYCHAFQPPPESKIPIGTNYAYHRNVVKPPYDAQKTYDCKWELDSLASFLQISSEYYNSTGDMGPFIKYRWAETVGVILDAAEAMRTATYTPDGHIAPSGYTMTGQTNRATETTSNDGLGNPIKYTGMIRSTFRPSDGQSILLTLLAIYFISSLTTLTDHDLSPDATIHQFLIPSNMMFARYLEAASSIMVLIETQEAMNLNIRMRLMASEIRAGIQKHGIVHHSLFGPIFAYEVDGYSSQNLMDDANLPSLLSAAMMGYVNARDEVYLNTRLFALSQENPYWMRGNAYRGIGGPHVGPGKAWPLAGIVRAMTSQEATGNEVREEIKAILNTTDGLGLVHEGVNVWNAKDWSRHW
ncbi:MAG: hypothetical protein L6R37_008150 [Teloschistes peruensis]|nr:MAG: hypothetical protein L6R37_008150 [Teloschistes peruensis]